MKLSTHGFPRDVVIGIGQRLASTPLDLRADLGVDFVGVHELDSTVGYIFDASVDLV